MVGVSFELWGQSKNLLLKALLGKLLKHLRPITATDDDTTIIDACDKLSE